MFEELLQPERAIRAQVCLFFKQIANSQFFGGVSVLVQALVDTRSAGRDGTPPIELTF